MHRVKGLVCVLSLACGATAAASASALTRTCSHFIDARLLPAGVKIHERRGVIQHSQTVLIDGVWATVGSTTLDWRSL